MQLFVDLVDDAKVLADGIQLVVVDLVRVEESLAIGGGLTQMETFSTFFWVSMLISKEAALMQSTTPIASSCFLLRMSSSESGLRFLKES